MIVPYIILFFWAVKLQIQLNLSLWYLKLKLYRAVLCIHNYYLHSPYFMFWLLILVEVVTNALNLLCLQIAYIVTTVAIMENIATMNLNILTILLLNKFLLANSFSNSSISCFSFKSKISLSCLYWNMYSFSVSGADSKELSNLLLFKNTGKVTSEVDLLVIVGTLISSVRVKIFWIISKCKVNHEIHY